MITIPTRGPQRPRHGSSCSRSSPSRSPAGGSQINPFDQPNVQQAKDATKRVLGDYERASPSCPPSRRPPSDAVVALLLGAAPPDYVAIMAYAEPSAELDAAIARAARGGARRDEGDDDVRLRARASCTRPASSTRAVRAAGASCSCSTTAPHDVEIPDAPYTFTTLKNAQAIGDLNTLRELGLPAERVRLAGADPAAAVRALCAAIEAAGESRAGEHVNQQSRPQAG